MSDRIVSRLRESQIGVPPERALIDGAIDAGLRHKRAHRAAVVCAGVVLSGLAFVGLGSLLNAERARISPDTNGLEPVVHRVETPVFSRPISAADRATSWTILSIEGASAP